MYALLDPITSSFYHDKICNQDYMDQYLSDF